MIDGRKSFVVFFLLWNDHKLLQCAIYELQNKTETSQSDQTFEAEAEAENANANANANELVLGEWVLPSANGTTIMIISRKNNKRLYNNKHELNGICNGFCNCDTN